MAGVENMLKIGNEKDPYSGKRGFMSLSDTLYYQAI